MWTTENPARYDRSALRYPSDLTDGEWALIAPLIPLAKRGGEGTCTEQNVEQTRMIVPTVIAHPGSDHAIPKSDQPANLCCVRR